jgi:hypothetical protein
VLTYPSPYRLSHFLAMYTQDHLVLPSAMRRQHDFHTKKSNKHSMHAPATTADPPKRDYIRSV